MPRLTTRRDFLRASATDASADRVRFLDAAAYALQPINTAGNAPRNSAWGPGLFTVDMSLVKRSHLACASRAARFSGFKQSDRRKVRRIGRHAVQPSQSEAANRRAPPPGPDVYAVAWNDFPDKNRILDVILTSPPLTRNRFVSSVTRLNTDQPVRILGARLRRRGFFLLGTADYHLRCVHSGRTPASSDSDPDGHWSRRRTEPNGLRTGRPVVPHHQRPPDPGIERRAWFLHFVPLLTPRQTKVFAARAPLDIPPALVCSPRTPQSLSVLSASATAAWRRSRATDGVILEAGRR